MESGMGVLGYIFGVFFGLVIVGVILYLFNKLIGGLKWSLAFVGLCVIIALYTHFPTFTIGLGVAIIAFAIMYKFCVPKCVHWPIADKNNDTCQHCHAKLSQKTQ